MNPAPFLIAAVIFISSVVLIRTSDNPEPREASSPTPTVSSAPESTPTPENVNATDDLTSEPEPTAVPSPIIPTSIPTPSSTQTADNLFQQLIYPGSELIESTSQTMVYQVNQNIDQVGQWYKTQTEEQYQVRSFIKSSINGQTSIIISIADQQQSVDIEILSLDTDATKITFSY